MQLGALPPGITARSTLWQKGGGRELAHFMVVMYSKIKIFPNSGFSTELLNRWQKESRVDNDLTLKISRSSAIVWIVREIRA